MDPIPPLSFADFPEEIQLCVLSFLRPPELSPFAGTSKRFFSICRDDKLWLSMCDRRWGNKTLIKKWGNGKISFKSLYRFLDQYETLIGFWRRCGDSIASSPPLLFFEWGPFYITGWRISPSKNRGYGVIKKPFLFISVTSKGELINYLDLEGKLPLAGDELLSENSVEFRSDLVQVNVNFTGKSHLVVEENSGFSGFSRVLSENNVRGEDFENMYGSPPDRMMSEIYQYFANRTSPGGNGASRRQRRREREKQGKKLEAEHFVKIANCSPNSSRPLEGLWKGICNDTNLDFYLVSYDDVGGIACRKVGDSSKPLSLDAPIFWSSSATFIESPLSREEDYIYNCRMHIEPSLETNKFQDNVPCLDDTSVSRMLYINSSYDLVMPDFAVNSVNSQQVEGRIWQYGSGNFGFGFLRDNYIIDLKLIAKNGQILDIVESSNA